MHTVVIAIQHDDGLKHSFSGNEIKETQKNTVIMVVSFIFIITNFVLSGIQQVTLDYFTTDG